MPLPAALAAKLAKRGIIENQAQQKQTQDVEEEVFAEDYDDPNKVEPPPKEVPVITEQEFTQPDEIELPVDTEPLFFETTLCPNRSNTYHECVPYCKKRYGLKKWDPNSTMIRRRDRMLDKYPLPEGWVEVGDFDTNRYYYWNVHTDQVSWLSPAHPKAVISQSAEALGLIGKVGNLDSDGEGEEMEEDEDAAMKDDDVEDSGSDTSLSDEEEIEYSRKKVPPKTNNRGGRGKKDELDPMDPAAYSDIPRGGWTEGLDQRGKAKTGVDATAAGPLFQQRPYPSPGEILRVNQTLKKKK